MKIQDITFDLQDKNLFLIEDLELKADAIRYSILPRLELISSELISRVTEVYDINFYEHYSIAKVPAFRLSKNQRKEPTKRDYEHSSVALTGQRKDDKWVGLDRGDGKVPKISPSSLSIELTTEGLTASFFFNHPKNFTQETYLKFFQFFIDELDIITGLANRGHFKYAPAFIDTFTIEEDLECKFNDEDYDVCFYTKAIDYPISYEEINDLLLSNVMFFPVLNACVDIALGKEPNLAADIKKLENSTPNFFEKYHSEQTASRNLILRPEELEQIKEIAKSKIKVQAGIRWQVFKRDNWKCLSCGRSAADNVILHIDHIVPRSKGGRDEMDNYQTLCDTCNIGKSNRDETDLRRVFG